MKIVTNEKLIDRNKKIGQYTTIGSLVILAGGLYLSFQQNSTQIYVSLAALLIGFALSQVGIYFGNRYGKSPRPDEVITSSLKGLEDKYTLYHYTTPIPHLLLGPSGAWVLIPYHQGGTITYERGRWKQKGGSWYLKFFAQDSLGRPDYEVEAQVDKIKKVFSTKMSDSAIPEIRPALVFTNPKANIAAEETPIPALTPGKLKDFIRKKAKESPLSPDQLEVLKSSLANT